MCEAGAVPFTPHELARFLCKADVVVESARALEAIVCDGGKGEKSTSGRQPGARGIVDPELVELVGKDDVIQSLLMASKVILERVYVGQDPGTAPPCLTSAFPGFTLSLQFLILRGRKLVVSRS